MQCFEKYLKIYNIEKKILIKFAFLEYKVHWAIIIFCMKAQIPPISTAVFNSNVKEKNESAELYLLMR